MGVLATASFNLVLPSPSNACENSARLLPAAKLPMACTAGTWISWPSTTIGRLTRFSANVNAPGIVAIASLYMSDELDRPVLRNSSSTTDEVPRVVVLGMISGILAL